MMQPSLPSPRHRLSSAHLISEVNDKFAARWADKARARRAGQHLSDDASELTLEIVLSSIFGSDLARLETQLGANPFEVVAKEQNRDLKFAFRFRSLTKLVGELIDRRRRRRPEEHFDFLSMLMATRDRETGEAMSDKELIDEVLTLIVAGHETTAAALTWTWYLVSQHPQTAERLHSRGRSHRRRIRPWAWTRAESLPFTHQVLQEALRLYPPGWLITRRTHRGGRTRRLPHRAAHRCVHQPVHAASASGLLERAGGVQARALCRRRCRGAASIRLYSLCGGAASLHRRESSPCSRCWCTCIP